MSVTTEARARVPEPAGDGDPRRSRVVAVGIGVVLAVAVVLRFVTTSDLWLDEALSVNVARLPLGDISEWLRHDGAPPLYYWMLHGWTEVFGTSALATRSLSGVLSVATLPFVYFAGRRLGGRTVGWAAVLLDGGVAVRHPLRHRSPHVLAGDAARGARLPRARARRWSGRHSAGSRASPRSWPALLYTQYWSLYLIAVVGLGLLWQAWKGPDPESRRAARGLVVAFVAGGIVFLPWVPNMLYQQEHTGTPWGEAILPNAVFTTTLEDFAGGGHIEDFLTFWLSSLLFLVAVFGVWVAKWRYELDLRARPGVRMVAARSSPRSSSVRWRRSSPTPPSSRATRRSASRCSCSSWRTASAASATSRCRRSWWS